MNYWNFIIFILERLVNKFKDGKTYFRFAVRTGYENKLVIKKNFLSYKLVWSTTILASPT